MAWSEAKVGLAEESLEVPGWDIIRVEAGKAADLTETVMRVLARIEGSTK